MARLIFLIFLCEINELNKRGGVATPCLLKLEFEQALESSGDVTAHHLYCNAKAVCDTLHIFPNNFYNYELLAIPLLPLNFWGDLI